MPGAAPVVIVLKSICRTAGYIPAVVKMQPVSGPLGNLKTNLGSISGQSGPGAGNLLTYETAMVERPVQLRPSTRSPRRCMAACALALAVLMLCGTSPAEEREAPSSTPSSRRVELAFTGDILPHLRVIRFARHYARTAHYPASLASIVQPPEMYQPTETYRDRQYDFSPMFEQVAPKLQAADLAICHLETVISSQSPRGYPRFRTPSELVEAIARTGWDGCSLASNHSMDQGTAGVAQTIGAMEEYGLGFAGTATGPQSPGAAHYQVNGIHLAHLSYTHGLNGLKLPRGEDWWVNLIDVETIAADAATARNEGAEFIIVSLHWGTEYRRMPDSRQRQVAQAIAEKGTVDLVIGHHAHVIQPVDRIDDMWVVYGLGNFLSNQTPTCCTPSSGDGAILHVVIDDSPDGLAVRDMTYTPTWVDRTVMQVVPVADRLLDPDLERWRQAALKGSWSRTVEAFGALGAHRLGIRPTISLP